MDPVGDGAGTPFLDAVERELLAVSPGLRGTVWERTAGNWLDAAKGDPASWILQVPDCWGFGGERFEKPGVRAFLDRVTANIAAAERSVDITTFGMPPLPGSPVEEYPDGAFLEAIAAGLKVAAGAAVRGGRRLKVRVLAGVLNVDVFVSPWGFRDRLIRMIGDASAAVDFSVAAMTTRGCTSYNHTKFVLVDGVAVIHGGINWMTNFYIEDGPYGSRGFGGSAPVTDLDIALRGPAAMSAGKFLDVLWAWTRRNASTSARLGCAAWLATNHDRVEECDASLYAGPVPSGDGPLEVISVGSLGYGIAPCDPTSEYRPPPVAQIEQAACDYWLWGARSNNETNTDRDFMTVNPDANAIRALVAAARRKIVLSQQDINGYGHMPLYHALFDVRLLDVLAAKLTADPPVKVRIVLSNPGYPDYSNIASIGEAANAIFRRVRLLTGSTEAAQRAMAENLQLAPLRVSDRPTWPNGYKYRLHTKVVCVDDRAFYVGSRNAYPDTTQDHGFIIEDAAAAAQLNAVFLDRQWRYSKAAAVYDWETNPGTRTAKL